MDATRLNVFLANLQAADLLTPAQLEEIARSPLTKTADPAPLAKDLVQRGWLTSYQVNQLIRGNGKELVLGQYRILDRLGEGGMGQVFKAFHKPLERIVALKVIRKERVSNPDAVKRFHREVQSTASLEHPNIIAAYDAGQVGGTHYLAMEFVDGTDLSKLVRKTGALAPEQACEFIRQAALGLQHAHEKGLVHRDIKPSNLLVAGIKTPESGVMKGKPTADAALPPCVKILDMGLARFQGSEPQDNLTRIGCVVGTPDFLAPEQAKNSSAVDIRADLYSLGCTFFFLLAGQSPYRAESATDVMIKHLTSPLPSLETFRGDVPAPVQAIIKKLMAKKPEDRFQTPAELAEALQPFCGARSDAAAPPSSVVRKKKSSGASVTAAGPRKTPTEKVVIRPSRFRRRPRNQGLQRAAVMGAAVVLVGGAVGLGAMLYHVAPADHEAAQASTQPATRRSSSSLPATSRTQPVATIRPKVETKPETKPTPPATKPQTKTEPPATKPQTKTEPPATKPQTKPEPKPQPKPEPKPDTAPKPDTRTKPEPKPEPKPRLVKPEAPNEADLAVMVGLIRQEYGKDFKNPDLENQRRLAKRLIEESARTENLKRRYALLWLARRAGADGANLDLAFEAIRLLEEQFEVDGWKLRQEVVQVAADSPQPARTLAEFAAKTLQLAEQAVAQDRYPVARNLMPPAVKMAQRANSRNLLLRAARRAREIAEIERNYPRFQSAVEVLKTKGDDPEASTRWGTFLCLYKGRWGEGLPLLVQGDDQVLKGLAQRDLAKPQLSDQQVDLGKGWFDYASGQTGLPQTQALLRARQWYQSALARMGVGPQRSKVEGLIRDVEKRTGIGSASDKPDPRAKDITRMSLQEVLDIAHTAYQEGKFADALTAYTVALQHITPTLRNQPAHRRTMYEYHMCRGYVSMQQRTFERAAHEFKRALYYRPNDPTAQDRLREAQAGGQKPR